ncbi:MAG: bifunctional proline dehydrogenase/L-glutamate gamma-semialdehyde dehydrogenase [Deltaproteobacteria bacterium]|nr:bifunctional proline dehydrogenase/L-glutamate gamma-semialdehyde dehydrogenase [Deltaproteobacteria bacterium]
MREIARDLTRRAAGRRPAIFEPRDWLRRMIEQSLDDEPVRTALFRFVDVLPSLRGARDVGAHLEEYFAAVDHALGGLTLLAHTLHAGWLLAPVARKNVTGLARRFIAEENPRALAEVLGQLRAEPAAFTLDLVGEETVSQAEAQRMLGRYQRLLAEAAAVAAGWDEVERIDRDDRGPLARVNVSVKLSSLYARFDPLDPDAERVAALRLRRLLRDARRAAAAITVDMEQHAFKETTLAVFRSVLEEPEFAESPPAAVALQTYLRDAEADLEALLGWAHARRRRIGVRLVKGAYWDSEVAWARQKGWPPPVFLDKAQTDLAFERCSRRLLEERDLVDAAFGSHNLRSIAHAIACARELGLAPGAYEIQMLHGMAEPLRRALIDGGERVRVYLPVGDLIPGMAYLIRRLLENTSNVSFLRESYAEGRDVERLIAPPAADREPRAREPAGAAAAEREFRNEPPRDFSREAAREGLGGALDAARASLGAVYPLRIGGEEVVAGACFESVNPANPAEVIGRVPRADAGLVERAVAEARQAFAAWSRTPLEERAAVLRRAAAEMRRRRDELSARIILEVGKGWRDADAEVCEAVDYLEYYAAEMRRIGERVVTERLPGETGELRYEPLGVAAVIAPWNFPLAIPAGMAAAALVAGNTVVVKPAEQSPVLGAELHAVLLRAGVPPPAASLVQGGAEVGAALVRHGDVRLVAFTGSRAVGLEILRAAAVEPTRDGFLKRAVCEMGGKNAIIVDRDADQDEALAAILESAFGYQGQKCSAASRLIVVGDGCATLLPRLVEATRTLRIGPPEDPRHQIGPLIDAEARDRVLAAVARAGRDGELLTGSAEPLDAAGFFVPPAIVAGLDPRHPLAQEEVFGPLLCVLRAPSFERAVELANQTAYGLTGGVFSRSPAHLEQARRELRVGNLYLNRAITGAVVGRQPFGGLKLSGAGWKAGGPDYLKQFLESRTIAENTQRHGFAPPP